MRSSQSFTDIHTWGAGEGFGVPMSLRHNECAHVSDTHSRDLVHSSISLPIEPFPTVSHMGCLLLLP